MAVLHAALVSAYPTEDAARAAFEVAPHEPYRGIWQAPAPHDAVCHVFSDLDDEKLLAAGWRRPETTEA
jgi:hypothetical protein